MQTEGIVHLKITKDSTRHQTRYLSPCGTVPQPTAAWLAPVIQKATLNFGMKLILFAY
jgi:hypothetical protein